MKAIVLTTTLGIAVAGIGIGQLSLATGSGTETAARTAGDLGLRQAAQVSDTTTRHETGETTNAAGAGIGPDIVYSGIYQLANYALASDHEDYDPDDPIYAYALGSRTCNIGDEPLLWQNNGTPGFASNAYRLHNGRLMQVGMAWVKHACCVFNQQNTSVCGMSCSSQGPPGTLRAGCLDVYTAATNAFHGRLGPRTKINPYSGAFSPLPGGTGLSAIERRLQVRQSDLSLTNHPGALFFVEGVYVCTDSAAAGNWHNNASHRRVTVNQTSFEMSTASPHNPTIPAIYAWQDHGNGLNQPDPDVEIITIDHPSEGRFFAGYKVSDNGDGTWRYEYAVYNLNSDLAAGGFSVNVGEGVEITNIGFHAPRYHSGEEQDNSPWDHTIANGSMTWSTTETHSQNPTANAIRWATLYNFWFDADTPPIEQGGTIYTFKPHAVSALGFNVAGPSKAIDPCPADLNDDDVVDSGDLLILLASWGPCPGCDADLNADEVVDSADLLILLAAWGDCPE